MKVTNLLKELGVKQVELAKRASMSSAALCNHLKWERTQGKSGKRIGPLVAAKIARASGGKVSLFDLYPELEVVNNYCIFCAD